MGTEAKSPREIAADAIIERLLDHGDAEAADELIALRSAVNRLKSYAAERERLLAEADAVIAEGRWADDAHEQWHQRAHQRQFDRLKSSLSSRPATEGKDFT